MQHKLSRDTLEQLSYAVIEIFGNARAVRCSELREQIMARGFTQFQYNVAIYEAKKIGAIKTWVLGNKRFHVMTDAL